MFNGAWTHSRFLHRPGFFFRCGYTVSKVSNGRAEFVHETSVKHYKDNLTFTFAKKVRTPLHFTFPISNGVCRDSSSILMYTMLGAHVSILGVRRTVCEQLFSRPSSESWTRHAYCSGRDGRSSTVFMGKAMPAASSGGG